MAISSLLLFFFSALGAFNGLLLTAYLFFSRPGDLSRRLLAGLLLVVSIRISKSIWFYFDPDIGKQFLQLGLSACFLIGPMLFFYVGSVMGRLTNAWQWHLVALLILVITVGILYPYQIHPALWGGWFYRLINWTWAIYIVLAGVMLFPFLKAQWKRQEPRPAEQTLMLTVFVGVGLIWLAYFTSSYTSYIVGALSFSFIFYLTVLLWFVQRKQKQPGAYRDKKIDGEIEAQLLLRLQHLMAEEALYKNPNLTLPLLAKKLQTSVPQVSQLLNDNLQSSFALYVNQWRVNEAKRVLLAEPKLTMELVAEACGYNSQSTFYAAFKQFEQTTPAKFRTAHQRGEITHSQ